MHWQVRNTPALSRLAHVCITFPSFHDFLLVAHDTKACGVAEVVFRRRKTRGGKQEAENPSVFAIHSLPKANFTKRRNFQILFYVTAKCDHSNESSQRVILIVSLCYYWKGWTFFNFSKFVLKEKHGSERGKVRVRAPSPKTLWNSYIAVFWGALTPIYSSLLWSWSEAEYWGFSRKTF